MEGTSDGMEERPRVSRMISIAWLLIGAGLIIGSVVALGRMYGSPDRGILSGAIFSEYMAICFALAAGAGASARLWGWRAGAVGLNVVAMVAVLHGIVFVLFAGWADEGLWTSLGVVLLSLLSLATLFEADVARRFFA